MYNKYIIKNKIPFDRCASVSMRVLVLATYIHTYIVKGRLLGIEDILAGDLNFKSFYFIV